MYVANASARVCAGYAKRSRAFAYIVPVNGMILKAILFYANWRQRRRRWFYYTHFFRFLLHLHLLRGVHEMSGIFFSVVQRANTSIFSVLIFVCAQRKVPMHKRETRLALKENAEESLV